jgi:hypothetical protein
MRTCWGHIGNKEEIQKITPSTPPPKGKNRAHGGCMLSLLTGCIKLLFLKLFVTIFGVGYWQGQKFGDTT